MPTFRITSPDGKTYEVTGPEGSTAEQALQRVQASLQPQEPASVSVGRGLMEIPRQIGLAARYGAEGLGQAAEIVTEPVRSIMELLGAPKMPSLGQGVSGLADAVGLPKPETADERVIGDASKLVAGAGGMAGAARGVANATSGVISKVAGSMAAAPGMQAAAGAAAGTAGGSVREAGGSPGAQFAAALAAGLAAPLAGMGVKKITDAAGRVVQQAYNPQQVEIVLKTELAKQGVNWADLGGKVQQQLREDARKAVYSGQPMSREALARLVDYRRVGATPLVGDLTQDPALLTQQRNLSKQLANSGTRVMGGDLPAIQNENAGKVLSTLEGVATSPLDEHAVGQGVINSVRTTDAKQAAATSALYDTARDTAGRSLPLDGATFTRRANEALQQNLSPKLGAEVDNLLNDIASGKTPLTVEYAEQIKTMLARKQRASADGDIRHAYGLVRQALEDTPLQGAGQVLPGTAGQESIAAFNAARSSAKAGFAWKGSAKFIEDALDGAAPDKFVRTHVIGAPVGELAKMQAQIAGDPDLVNGVRRQLVDYIMQRGSADSKLTTFSGAGMEKGLKALGDRKLALFFSPEEVEQIKSAVNVARLSQSQPIGTAVNNSNTAAAAGLGRLSDLLGKTTGIPVLGPMVGAPAQTLLLQAQSVPLRNISNALANKPPRQSTPILPLSALLLSPSAQGGQDNDGR